MKRWVFQAWWTCPPVTNKLTKPLAARRRRRSTFSNNHQRTPISPRPGTGICDRRLAASLAIAGPGLFETLAETLQNAWLLALFGANVGLAGTSIKEFVGEGWAEEDGLGKSVDRLLFLPCLLCKAIGVVADVQDMRAGLEVGLTEFHPVGQLVLGAHQVAEGEQARVGGIIFTNDDQGDEIRLTVGQQLRLLAADDHRGGAVLRATEPPLPKTPCR